MRIIKIASGILLTAIILFILSPLYLDKLFKFYNYITRIHYQKHIEKYYQDSEIPVTQKFHVAVSEGDKERIVRYIYDGADIYAPDDLGSSALHIAAMKGHTDIVKYLLNIGLDTDMRDSFERTPLMLAAQYGKIDVIRYLINSGASVNVKDAYGHSALSCALETGEEEAASLLKSKGAKN